MPQQRPSRSSRSQEEHSPRQQQKQRTSPSHPGVHRPDEQRLGQLGLQSASSGSYVSPYPPVLASVSTVRSQHTPSPEEFAITAPSSTQLLAPASLAPSASISLYVSSSQDSALYSSRGPRQYTPVPTAMMSSRSLSQVSFRLIF